MLCAACAESFGPKEFKYMFGNFAVDDKKFEFPIEALASAA